MSGFDLMKIIEKKYFRAFERDSKFFGQKAIFEKISKTIAYSFSQKVVKSV